MSFDRRYNIDVTDPRAREIAVQIRSTEAWYGLMVDSGDPVHARLAAALMVDAIATALNPGRTWEARIERANAYQRARSPEEKRVYAREYYARRRAAERKT